MTSIYLSCDSCGATLDGKDVTAAQNGLHWSHTDELRVVARRIGWTGPLTRESNSDRCPACSAKVQSASNAHKCGGGVTPDEAETGAGMAISDAQSIVSATLSWQMQKDLISNLREAQQQLASLKHQHKNDEAANKLLLAALDHAKAPMRCIGYINPAAVVPGSAGRIVSEYEDLDGCILPVFVPSANTC